MRFGGTLITWHDDRGFGFIQPTQGGQEIFVHIKAFPPGTGRPQVGQVLSFEIEPGPHGKKLAHAVQYPARRAPPPAQRVEPPAAWTAPRLLAIPVFIGLCMLLAPTVGVRPMVWLGYGLMGIITFFAYAFDKAAAVGGGWRTRESTLHLLALAGGWPGALLAQQWLRHKTSKPSFMATFWVTVALNTGLFVAWHTAGWRG